MRQFSWICLNVSVIRLEKENSKERSDNRVHTFRRYVSFRSDEIFAGEDGWLKLIVPAPAMYSLDAPAEPEGAPPPNAPPKPDEPSAGGAPILPALATDARPVLAVSPGAPDASGAADRPYDGLCCGCWCCW